jgi:nucleotide-binding universal stress UspA family protein
MTNSRFTPPRRIVVGIDYEQLGDDAFRAALALAVAAGGTEVHAIHVTPLLDGMPTSQRKVERMDKDVERLRQQVDAVLGTWRERHGDPAVPSISVHIAKGRASTEIVRLAAALQAGLVIVGTHGRRGLTRALLGSIAGEIVEKATCPVLVVRPIEHQLTDAVADVEPVCEACQARRMSTGGQELWCERHAEHHPRAHVYSGGGGGAVFERPWGFH